MPLRVGYKVARTVWRPESAELFKAGEDRWNCGEGLPQFVFLLLRATIPQSSHELPGSPAPAHPSEGEPAPVPPGGDPHIPEAGLLPAHRLVQDTRHRTPLQDGGNAGMAAAYSARRLGVPATIVVPVVTPSFTVQRLKDEGATVLVHGKELKESIEYGQQLVANNAGWVFVSPYDDPLIWEGHTSLVRELEAELEVKPGAVVLSVGGGGLLCGVVEGLRRAGWGDIPIVAMETVGAHSLNAAMEKGELVTLPKITSVATTLGLNRVAAQTLKLAQEHAVFSQLVTDQEAVMAVEHFMDDEKILVEPACGAALAAVYSNVLSRLQKEGKLGQDLGPVVVVVCGGNNISLAQLHKLKVQLEMSC